MVKNPKVYLYARVSTDEQRHDSQLDELRSYCDRRGWKPAKTITDTISGTKSDRRGLDELMAAVRRGAVDVVLIYKLDRLGRSLPHLAQILAELEIHRATLVCTSQGIDTSDDNPAGRLQRNILAAVADFERALISERTRAGVSAARRRGKTLGRPKKIDLLRPRIAELHAAGKKQKEIAGLLRISAGSVNAVLKK